jgi:hypothetical protein
MYPAQDLAVVVLSNQTNPLPFVVASQIENVLLPGRAEAMVAERTTQQGNARQSFAAPADLLGDWSGTVRTYQGTIPITLRVKADEVLVRLGAGQDALWSLVNRPRYDKQMLEGVFVGDVPTPDAMRYPHNLALSLFNADGKLRGFVASVATNRPDVGGAVSSYAELMKQ